LATLLPIYIKLLDIVCKQVLMPCERNKVDEQSCERSWYAFANGFARAPNYKSLIDG